MEFQWLFLFNTKPVNMKILLGIASVVCSIIVFSCKSGSSDDKGPADFCKADCGVDTIQVAGENKEKPFVMITMNNCKPDSITWGSRTMAAYRQMEFPELVGKDIKINQEKMRISVYGNDYAWLVFNECKWGQGYIVKLPFNKTDNIFRKSSAFNSLDRKYNVDTSIVAYSDRGNIFIEQMSTGKKAMMTFGEMTDMEYDAMHETVDSVNITPTRIWAKVKIGKEWKEIEKDITLE